MKTVLEAIPVYLMSLAWIPLSILETTRRTYFRFLWSGKHETQVTPWVRWERIAILKGLGDWVLKNIFLFAKDLVAKGGWRLINSEILWTQVMIQKYLAPKSVED